MDSLADHGIEFGGVRVSRVREQEDDAIVIDLVLRGAERGERGLGAVVPAERKEAVELRVEYIRIRCSDNVSPGRVVVAH